MTTEYSLYWDTKVKALAQRCIDNELVRIMVAGDKFDKFEVIKGRERAEKYADPTSQYYISQMIWAIEHDLADGRECGLNSLNTIVQVRDTLASESYWQNVWKEKGKDLQSEEAKNLIALRDELTILLEKSSR